MRVFSHSKPHHFNPVCKRFFCIFHFFVRRISVGQKPDFIQMELLIGKFTKQQMSDMNRVKGSAHNSDSHRNLPTEVRFFLIVFSFFVQYNFFADDLYDLRTGALSHHFCQSSRIIRTVLQYTDLDQFTCIKASLIACVRLGVMLDFPI